MPETSVLLVLLLFAVLGMGVLLVIVLLRKPDGRLEQALRDEQRDGRGELRQQLDGMSLAQEQRIEGFGARIGDLIVRTDQTFSRWPLALDEPVDELYEDEICPTIST